MSNRHKASKKASVGGASSSPISSSSSSSSSSSLRVAFLHPNLGIGGAERLVVDCASALQKTKAKHKVEFFTNYHDPQHCYPETIDGSFPVTVYAQTSDHLFGRFRVLIAILRMLYLTLMFALFHAHKFDVCVVDQVSHAVPIIKWFTKCKVLFYCHFPDQLLSTRTGLLKRLYRLPVDRLEEATTGCADLILVNSLFTLRTFQQTFTRLQPMVDSGLVHVLYPSIDFARYRTLELSELPQLAERERGEIQLLHNIIYQTEKGNKGESYTRKGHLLTSINRFERKKNIQLAIEAFAIAQERREQRQTSSSSSSSSPLPASLLISGGYDPVNLENVAHYRELWEFCLQKGLTPVEIKNNKTEGGIKLEYGEGEEAIKENKKSGQSIVYFLRSFTDVQRSYLLSHSLCILYTPSNEHFGIVPIEAMYMRRPVIACRSGGPVESVVDANQKETKEKATGWLCQPVAEEWSQAMETILDSENSAAAQQGKGKELTLCERMGERGRQHVSDKFHFTTFQTQLEKYITELVAKPQ